MLTMADRNLLYSIPSVLTSARLVTKVTGAFGWAVYLGMKLLRLA